MAITTYSELVTAAQNWLARSDSDIQSRIPEFIALAETRIRWGSNDPEIPSPPLRARQMQQRATASVSDAWTELPSDYLEMVKLKLNSDPVIELQYLSPVQFDRTYTGSQTGTPIAFTVFGSELRVGPSPEIAMTVEMWYFKDIPALTSSASTNWLLSASPSVYLYGVLLEAAPYVGEDERINVATWARAFSAAVGALQVASMASQYGGQLVRRSGAGTP